MLDKDPQSSGIIIRQLHDDIVFMKNTDVWDASIITKTGGGKKRYYCYEDSNFSISKISVKETHLVELKMLVDAFEDLPQPCKNQTHSSQFKKNYDHECKVIRNRELESIITSCAQGISKI